MSLNQVTPPRLADLIGASDLPGIFGSAAEALLNGLYFGGLRSYRSPAGDRGTYSLEIEVLASLSLLEVPGTDLAVVLNPPDETGVVTSSSFEVSASYELAVLRWIRGFDVSSFDFSLGATWDLISRMFFLSEEDLLRGTVRAFHGDPDDPSAGTGFLQDFVDRYNAAYDPDITSFTDLADVAAQISSAHDLAEVVLDEYVAGDYENLRYILLELVGDVSSSSLEQLITPRIKASIRGISLAVTFPRALLQPIDDDGSTLAEPAVSMLRATDAALLYDSVGGISFNADVAFTLSKSALLGTGLTMELEQVTPYLTPGGCPYLGSDVGHYEDFTGVYIGAATIGLPSFWSADEGASTAEIKGTEVLIGTGGFSGTIALAASTEDDEETPLLVTRLGGDDGFSLTLDAFDLTIQQNAFIETDIHGTLTIPGFETQAGDAVEIEVQVRISDGGGFEVTAIFEDPLTIVFPDVFTLEIASLSIGSSGDRWFVEVSGALEITATIPGITGSLLPDRITVEKLRIYTDGSVELEGGSIILDEALTLNAGPAQLSVTAIHYGSHEQEHDGLERRYAYFGFDGGMSVDPGGVDARGDGIKLFFSTDHRNDPTRDLHLFLKIESIRIDLTIPGEATPEKAALLLSGYLSMKNPDPDVSGSAAGTEYTGGVAFSIPKISLGGSAAMRLNPDVPAFAIDLGLEMAAPWPLGTTGLGIYGFRGLVGSNYVATKTAAGLTDDDDWYAYYKAKISPDFQEGIQLSKFEQKDGFSLGAGVSLATAPDTGRAFSSKLFFLLSLPEVFLLQGQGALLSQRVGLDTTDDPPFSALIAISSESVEAAFGVDYSVPDGGEILEIGGTAELGFFFGDATSWYINVGRDTPEDKRIRATLLTLFKAYSYLMLSSEGIRAGAGASWDFDKKYGPAEVGVGAYLDVGGKISFKPVQVGGYLNLGGYAYVSVFKFKIGFDVSAAIAAEAPRPFIVTGSFRLIVNLPKPFKDLEIPVSLTWVFNETVDDSEIEFFDDSSERESIKSVNVMSGEYFPVLHLGTGAALSAPGDWDDYVIPVDSYVDIEFTKPVRPDQDGSTLGRYGGIVASPSYTEKIPPQRGKSEQVDHEFHVRNVYVKYWNGSYWSNYDFYTAMTPLEGLDDVSSSDLASANFGYWQLADGADRYNKLRVLAETPLSYATQGSNGNPIENFGFTAKDIDCPEDEIVSTCIDWERVTVGTTYPPNESWLHRNVFFHVAPDRAGVQPFPNPHGFDNGLVIQEGSVLTITLRESVAKLDLTVSTLASYVVVRFLEKVRIGTTGGLPDYEYREVSRQRVAQSALVDPIEYDAETPIRRITLEGGLCKTAGGSLRDCLEDVLEAVLTMLEKCCRKAQERVRELQQRVSNPRLDDDVEALRRLLAEAIEDRDEICGELKKLRDAKRGPCADQAHHDHDCCKGSKGTLDRYLQDSCQRGWALHRRFERICKEAADAVQEIQDLIEALGSRSQRQLAVLQARLAQATAERNRACLRAEQIAAFLEEACAGRDDTRHDTGESSRCVTALHQLCYLTVDEARHNEGVRSLEDAAEDTDKIVDAMEKLLHPIWRPNTTYAIQIETENIVNGVSKGNRLYNYGFKTEGPVGWFHQFRGEYDELLAQDRASEFRLAKLKDYVDSRRSYPDPSGRLTGAKPLFYTDVVLSLHYLHDYVFMMYANWDPLGFLDGVESALSVVIKDPSDTAEAPAPFTLHAEVGWTQYDAPVVNKEISAMINLLTQGDTCTERSPEQVTGMFSATPPVDLEPLKLYTALYGAHFVDRDGTEQNNIVLDYVFRTSRYSEFSDQVGSWKIVDPDGNGIPAVFEVPLSPTTDQLTSAQQIVQDTMSASDPLVSEYSDPFERLLYGALRLESMHPATGTEFNVVRTDADGTVLGILVRNPEPFNDPRLPDDVAATMLELTNVLTSTGATDASYSVVLSRDLSEAFVTNGSLDIPDGSLTFTFRYFTYDGTDYAATDETTASFTI